MEAGDQCLEVIATIHATDISNVDYTITAVTVMKSGVIMEKNTFESGL